MTTHVLIIPSWYPSNPDDPAGCFFREQAIALTREGDTVGVIAPFGLSLRHPERWSSAAGIDITVDSGVVTYRKNFVSFFGRLPYVGAAQWVQNGLEMYDTYVREHGEPDVIHAHSIWNAGLLANEISRRHGKPLVLTEHSTAFARGKVKRWQARWAERVVAQASALIAVSQPFGDLLSEFFRADSNWRIVPNIVDDGFLLEDMPCRDGRKEFVFASIGYMEEKKNHQVLIRAFADAFANEPGVKIIFGGDGPLRSDLEDMARDLGIDQQVTFAGMLTRNQVVETLKASDAFVLPSRVETFGVVVAESLALGLPVVVTNCGGPESFVSEQDGLVVTNGDRNGLAQALRTIVDNRSHYSAEKIRDRCRALFSRRAVVAKLHDIYAEAKGEGRI